MDVYLVPGLGQNLFSIRAAAKNGLTHIGSSSDIAFFKDQTELFKANLQNNLYIIKFVPTQSQPRAMAATLDIWHSRFAHVSRNTIKHMKQKDIVEDLIIVDEIEDNCMDCVVSKISNVPHPIKTSEKGTRPSLTRRYKRSS